MLPVLPLDVTITGLLEVERVEACCQGDPAKPLDDGNVHSVGSGISDDETDLRRCAAHPPQCRPDSRQVKKIAPNHVVVGLLTASVQSNLSKLFAHGSDLPSYRRELGSVEDIGEVHCPVRNMLRAGAKQMPANTRLQVSPALDFTEESQLETRCVGVVVVVGVRRGSYDEVETVIGNGLARPGVVQTKSRSGAGESACMAHVFMDDARHLLECNEGIEDPGLSPIGQKVLTVGRTDVGGGAQDTNEYEPDEPGGFRTVIVVLDYSSETIELFKSLVRVAPSDDRSIGFQRWRDASGCDERILCSFEKFFGGGSVSEFGPRDSRHERMRIDSPGLYPAVFGGNKSRAASSERIEDLDVAALRFLRDKVFGPGPR